MAQDHLIDMIRIALGDVVEFPALDEDFRQILLRAQEHQVLNLIYYALPRLQIRPSEDICNALKRQTYAAVSREVVQQQELQKIFDIFEKKRISVLPLKGCVIKHLYPKPEMRLMSDTDLLIRAEQAASARQAMIELGYREGACDDEDTDLYFSPHGLKYEVHRALADDAYNQSSKVFLSELFTYAKQIDGKHYIYELGREEHYVYILCHFVKHFLGKGIGIRHVLDIYFCTTKWQLNEERLNLLLNEFELLEFSKVIQKLAMYWFAGGQADESTLSIGRYIMNSGVFGKDSQQVANRMIRKKKGKFAYYRSRIFPSYRVMCTRYPSLNKLPFMLPIYWITRLVKAGISRSDKISAEIDVVQNSDDTLLQEKEQFYRSCGLNIHTKE